MSFNTGFGFVRMNFFCKKKGSNVLTPPANVAVPMAANIIVERAFKDFNVLFLEFEATF